MATVAVEIGTLGLIDLERRFTARAVAQLSDDDGDRQADPDVIGLAFAESIELAHGLLRSGFPDDEGRALLIENDVAVRGLVCRLTMSWLGTRPHTLKGGTEEGPYFAMGAAARKDLEKLASGALRARQEGRPINGGPLTGPTNAHIATGVQRVPNRSFVFLSDPRSNKRPGGF